MSFVIASGGNIFSAVDLIGCAHDRNELSSPASTRHERPQADSLVMAAGRSRNGHKRISMSAALWHNTIDRQIMAQCAFEDHHRDDACRTGSLPLCA